MSNSLKLTTASIVARRQTDMIDAEVGGNIVAFDVDKGELYGLNGTGSLIWRLLADARSIENICAHLVASHKVDLQVCEQEVLQYLDELRSENLIEVIASHSPQ